MKVTSKHIDFEAALELAFPCFPVPSLENVTSVGWVESELKELFFEKTWAEVVGDRLIYGDMDLSLNIWMKSLPSEVFDYYVASHLKSASIFIGRGLRLNYVTSVVEAFILPPFPESDEAVAEIDAALASDADVARDSSMRLDFYRRITPAQRACIGRFLDLYLVYQGTRFRPRGVHLFEQNRDYWLHSSRGKLVPGES